MAEGSAAVPSTELLEWPKKDKRRFLHAVYRVGDLDRTIKFYTECFGMKLLRKRDIPEEKYSNAFLGFGPEESHFVVELTYNYGVTSYDIGTGFGHFAIATPDVYKMVEDIRAKGGNITREPGPVKGGSSVIAFVKDPDGYIFELIQRASTPEPLCQVMLRVGDLDRSVKFYEKALGMKLVKKVDRPEYKYSIAMMGYAEEHETTVLELTYNYGVTEYTKGNAYAQVAISTDDVYKSGEVVEHVIQELGGKVTRKPGPIPGINTKITSFLDPDGWKTVLVDNEDFLKELKPEDMRYKKPVSVCNETTSDLAGEIVAALSAASIIYEITEKKTGFTAITYTTIDACGGEARRFYGLSRYEDELVRATTWLFFATGNLTFLDYATTNFAAATDDETTTDKGIFYCAEGEDG
ncbi:hypothetical protein GOBAR_DD05151 [Gossypium barbadense]|nr:hypothetical protein GOBAR_DD05151 [Gossypium barbadense]